MGIADAILDLVSSGTTLRENNLKEIEGGIVLKSQVNFHFFMLMGIFLCKLYMNLETKASWKTKNAGCFCCKQALLNPTGGRS